LALDYFMSAGITFGSLVESLTITERFVLIASAASLIVGIIMSIARRVPAPGLGREGRPELLGKHCKISVGGRPTPRKS
jgi:hypothetical protein